MNDVKKNYTLSNGLSIPAMGFGTWDIRGEDETAAAVIEAVKSGYRLIDGAAFYGNEIGVGKGIAGCDAGREELFVTSKLWKTELGYDSALRGLEKSLKDLGLEYLDLYLIHWPMSSVSDLDWININRETWKAFIYAYKQGLVKSIGVSNFLPHHLQILEDMEMIPMVNQIEYHPGYVQENTVKYCKEKNIVVEAWSPLGRGRVLNDEGIVKIAKKHGKDAGQICLRYELENGIIPIPKTVNPDRMKSNLNIFDFELDSEDYNIIENIKNSGWSGEHPDM